MMPVDRFSALCHAGILLRQTAAEHREFARRCQFPGAIQALEKLAADYERADQVLRELMVAPDPALDRASQLEQAVRALLTHPFRSWLVVNHHDAFQRLVDVLDDKATPRADRPPPTSNPGGGEPR